jgi:hypothetical protein
MSSWRPSTTRATFTPNRAASAQLRARKEQGEDVDPSEHISVQMHEPGYRRRQRNAHLLKRAIQHGVVPALIDELELPPNVSYARAERLPSGSDGTSPASVTSE